MPLPFGLGEGQGEGMCTNPLAGQVFPLTPTLYPSAGEKGGAFVHLVVLSAIPVFPQSIFGYDSERGTRIVDVTLAPLASVPVVERVG